LLAAQLANAGVNCWRFLPVDVWNGVTKKEDVLAPVMLIGGKWDWTKWNPEYFRVRRLIYKVLNKYNIKPVHELLDNCNVNGPDSGPAGKCWNQFSPWRVNVQGFEDFYDKTLAWIEKCLAEFGDLNIGWGECNEGQAGIRRVAAEILNPFFHKHNIMPFCYGATFKGLDKTSTLELMKKDAGVFFAKYGKEKETFHILRASHGCGSVAEPQFYLPLQAWGDVHPIGNGTSDDGWYKGKGCDSVVWEGKTQTRPSAAAWGEMVEYAVKNKLVDVLLWFEHGPKNWEKLECQFSIFRAMSEAIFKVNKKYPSNWKRWPLPVKPEPDIPPVIIIDEEKPEAKPPFNWRGWWNNNKKYVFRIIGVVALVILFFIIKGC